MTNALKVPGAGDEDLVKTLRINPEEPRPRHFMTELTLSQLQRLADEFDLGRIVRMEEQLTTQCNLTEPFRTGQGAFMIRIRHGEDFGERVEFIHAMMDYLRGCGMPVPEVMRCRDGHSWTFWGERIVEVHRYIRHDAGLHRDWQRMYAAAAALGELHGNFQKFTSDKPPVAPEMKNDLMPNECWNMLPHAERSISMAHGTAESIEAALLTLARAREALIPLLDDYERMLGNLPWSFVHGDFHLWNLLFHGDEIVGLVDYDFMQERERLFDVAYCMQAIIGYMHYVEGRRPEEYDRMSWGNLRLWVDQYDAACPTPLTREERERLPAELLRIYLVNLVVSGSQEEPLSMLEQASADFDLYLWIAKNGGLFL